MLGNIINILINVGVAMAPLASVVLDVALAITEFIGKLTEAHPIIGTIIGIVATLAGILMALAPAFIFVNQVIIPLITTFGGLSGIISVVMGAIEF